MGEVLLFKKPEIPAGPSAAEQEAETVRHFWQVQVNTIFDKSVDDVIVDVVQQFAHSPYLTDLELPFWGNIDFQFKFGEGDTRLELSSAFRPKLVPEFGCQENLMFLAVGLIADETPHKVLPTPDDLLQQLVAYANSFGQVKIANRMQFALAILASIIEHPAVDFIQAGVADSRFFAVFRTYNKKAEEGPICRFEFDFLPILLDNIATEYFEEVVCR